MRLSLAIFILGLASALALNDAEMEMENQEDVEALPDYKDGEIASESEEGPSFEEIKKKMEKLGVLKRPFVLG